MVDKDTEAAIIIQELEQRVASLESDKAGLLATYRKRAESLEMAVHGVERALRDFREAFGE